MKSNTPTYKPVSPFLESQTYAPLEEGEEAIDTESAAPSDYGLQTPFVSDYQVLEGTEEPVDSRQAQLTALMSELYNEEFDEEMYQLAAEAADHYRGRVPTSDNGNSGFAEKQVLQELESHFAPVQEDLEIILENMIAEIDEVDLENMPDEQKDLWVESFFSEEGEIEGEGPEIEEGFRSRAKRRRKRRKEKRKRRWKGIKNKIKKVVRKVGKRILKPALKFALRKLAKLAKPLLTKVLQIKSIKKHIPTRYLPLIDMLRKRLIKKEHADDEPLREWLSAGMAPLQNELDFHLASALLGEHSASAIEEEVPEVDSMPEAEAPSWALDEAREEFVEQLLSLKEHEDPTPHIEQFVVAVLQTIRFIAKPIIEAVGRDKVIKYLAKYVAKLTGRFIKKKDLNGLVATALVDVGLRLMKLEVEPEDEREAAAEAVAGMVEDTVRNSLELPASVFEHEELLEVEVVAAFEKAAADNLPPLLSEEAYRRRPHLRPSGNTKNAWLRLPLRKRRHRRRARRRYKKAIRSIRRRISAQAAREVMSFGEVSLESFLNEQMGIEIGSGVEAEIHLYEALPGTELFDIANQENYVPGLRGGYGFNYALLHPLTTQAAGLLLGEPALGRNVPAPYLSDRHRILPGQRFYYLELPGTQPQTVLEEGFLGLRRPSGTNLTLDFVTGKIEIDLFLGEKAAQDIAVRLKAARTSPGAWAMAGSLLSEGLRRNFSPVGQHGIRIAHPAVMPGAGSGSAWRRVPPYLTELLASRLKDWVLGVLSQGLRNQEERFVSATEHLEDGVTIHITLLGVPGLAEVRQILGNTPGRIPADIFEGTPDSTRLQIQPGYRHG
ncbi:MAG: hypothetical protein IPM58_02840 [Nitrospira sp.]|nr:hypothetical protein [Nitrospira sp.]